MASVSVAVLACVLPLPALAEPASSQPDSPENSGPAPVLVLHPPVESLLWPQPHEGASPPHVTEVSDAPAELPRKRERSLTRVALRKKAKYHHAVALHHPHEALAKNAIAHPNQDDPSQKFCTDIISLALAGDSSASDVDKPRTSKAPLPWLVGPFMSERSAAVEPEPAALKVDKNETRQAEPLHVTISGAVLEALNSPPETGKQGKHKTPASVLAVAEPHTSKAVTVAQGAPQEHSPLAVVFEQGAVQAKNVFGDYLVWRDEKETRKPAVQAASKVVVLTPPNIETLASAASYGPELTAPLASAQSLAELAPAANGPTQLTLPKTVAQVETPASAAFTPYGPALPAPAAMAQSLAEPALAANDPIELAFSKTEAQGKTLASTVTAPAPSVSAASTQSVAANAYVVLTPPRIGTQTETLAPAAPAPVATKTTLEKVEVAEQQNIEPVNPGPQSFNKLSPAAGGEPTPLMPSDTVQQAVQQPVVIPPVAPLPKLDLPGAPSPAGNVIIQSPAPVIISQPIVQPVATTAQPIAGETNSLPLKSIHGATPNNLQADAGLSEETKNILDSLPPEPRLNKKAPKPIDLRRGQHNTRDEDVKKHEAYGMKIAVKRPKMDVFRALENAYNALIAGDQTYAIAQYKEVLDEDPENTMALFGLATTYQRAGQNQLARPLYAQLLQMDPQNVEGLNNFLVLLADESPRQALVELAKLQHTHPSFSPVPAQMALIYEKEGEYSKAAEQMAKALNISPENLKYQYDMAIIYDKMGDWPEAAKWYQRLVAANSMGEKIPGKIDEIQQRLTFIRSNTDSQP